MEKDINKVLLIGNLALEKMFKIFAIERNAKYFGNWLV